MVLRESRAVLTGFAIASDGAVSAGVPVVPLDDIEAIADILVEKAAPREVVVARIRSA